MLTCKIALPDSPHPIIVKITDFGHFIALDGMNSDFFRLINTNKKYMFSFLAAGFCPKKLAFADLPENNSFVRLRGRGLQPPALLAL